MTQNESEFQDEIIKKLRNSDLLIGQPYYNYCTLKTKINLIQKDIKHPARPDGRPDLHFYFNNEISPKILLKWRFLSNPFFIETKMQTNTHAITDGILQSMRYKYRFKNEVGLDKYGDFHVAVTTPDLFFNSFSRRIQPENTLLWTLERVLWHLGLGLLYQIENKNGHKTWCVTFNELEKVYLLGAPEK